MNKLWLVIKREYLVRVKKKSFIIATLLTPFAIGLLMFASIYFTTKGGQANKKILVKDESGIFSSADIGSKTHTYEFSDKEISQLKDEYKTNGFDLLIHIPAFVDSSLTKHKVQYYCQEKLGISTIENVERKIGYAFKDYKVLKSGIDRDVYDSFKMDIDLENGAIKGDGSKGENSSSKLNTSTKLSTMIGSFLGGLMGFIMYMVIFIYGGMVMRSVMEEKINRIVEVIISSVKPTTLMLGKVFGVGAVGITQLGIWLILIVAMMIGMSTFMGSNIDPAQMQEIANQTSTLPVQDLDAFNWTNISNELGQMKWWLIIPMFVIFFFGGYMIYSSLFAAVGSAIGDDMGEGQQLMIPIMIPVFLGIFMLQGAVTNPNGGMAIFGSLFPLTSPIIMPARLPFDPPWWQIGLSILFLILACWFFAWLAGRIYRIGILMYGKKISFKELAKWITYK